jgi:hypothetical protein
MTMAEEDKVKVEESGWRRKTVEEGDLNPLSAR